MGGREEVSDKRDIKKNQQPLILIKVLLFSLIFLVIFSYVDRLVGLKQLTKPWDMSNKIQGFYNEPKESIQLMTFGSSHMYSSINPVQLEEETGIRSYSFATQQQPIWLTYHYMKEALKTQKPQFFVLDVLMLKQEDLYGKEGVIRTAIDILPMSWNKLEMIRVGVPREDWASYVVDFIKYHSRWTELTEEDWAVANGKLRDVRDPLRGYVALTGTAVIAESNRQDDEAAIKEPIDKVKTYLMKIITLAKEEGITLVFYKAPSNATEEEKMYFNYAEAVAKEQGIPFIDYNDHYEALGLDLTTDFYDQGHVNKEGAAKVTHAFGEYIEALGK